MTTLAPNTARAREQLTEIAALLPELGDVLATLAGLRGGGPDLATATVLTGSPVEAAVIATDRGRAPLDELDRIAADWGRHPGEADPVPWMAANIARVEHTRGRIEPEHLDTIAWAHATITRLVYRPKHAGTCPVGHEPPATMETTGPDQHYCPQCETTRTTTEIKALQRFRLLAADPHLTAAEAARLTGIKAATIRKWIERGHLTRDPEGRVSLAEVSHRAHQAR